MTRAEFYDQCAATDFGDTNAVLSLERQSRERLEFKVIYMQWRWHHERGTPKPQRPTEG